MHNPVHWFEIYVNNIDRARRFYQALLEVELTRLPADALPMWAFPQNPRQGGSSGALVQTDAMPAGGNSTVVYFSCTDCAKPAGRVAQLGGELVKAKFSIGAFGHIALVKDPDGNLIGLHSSQ